MNRLARHARLASLDWVVRLRLGFAMDEDGGCLGCDWKRESGRVKVGSACSFTGASMDSQRKSGTLQQMTTWGGLLFVRLAVPAVGWDGARECR